MTTKTQQEAALQREEERATKMLDAILGEKMLYGRVSGDEVMIFESPERVGLFIVLRTTYVKAQQLCAQIKCQVPSASMLLNQLTSPRGEYKHLEEISLEHPEVRRVLEFFRLWLRLNAMRAACGAHFIDPTRELSVTEDESESEPPDASPTIQFV